MTEWLQFIQYSAIQLLRELLREASRSGKPIAQLLDDAEKQTTLNEQRAKEIIEKFSKK